MNFLTNQQMRTWDQRAITERGIPGLTLMNRAGSAVALVTERMAELRGAKQVILIAGKGNNGGDAFVAARCLHEDGLRAEVWMTCAPEALRGDASGGRAVWRQS